MDNKGSITLCAFNYAYLTKIAHQADAGYVQLNWFTKNSKIPQQSSVTSLKKLKISSTARKSLFFLIKKSDIDVISFVTIF